jgi:hypothetical protein
VTQHILCKGQTAPAMLYTIVEVMPGVRLALLPGQDVAEVAQRLAWFFGEAAQLDEWANGDPHLARWTAYNVQPDYMRDGYIGD